jgi:hypothetical protein
MLPELDYEVRSPKFNVKRPDGKTDEEIVAEVEKKVVQMIGNYTHREWECAQKILKHQGHVNRVFDEMNVLYPPRPRPSTSGKKMQPPGNIGSELIETSKKRKRARRLERQRVLRRVQKPKMSWPSERQKLQKPPCPHLLKNLPSC